MAFYLRALACSIVLIAFTSGANADTRGHCKATDKLWFNAKIKDSDIIMSLCSSKIKNNDTIAWIQIRIGPAGKVVKMIPAVRKRSVKKFTYRRYTRFRTTYHKVEITENGRNYAILEGMSDDSTPPHYVSFRVRNAADETDISNQEVIPTTEQFSFFGLEYRVPTKPFDE